MSSSRQRGFRNRSIRDAISTSLVSKVSTLVLQFVSLPLAARHLGREEFGIFATVSLAVFSVAMLQLGVGPALARKLSEAAGNSDRQGECRAYLSGAILVVLMACTGFLVVALLITFVPITTLFGEKFGDREATMVPALWVGTAIMTGQIIMSLTDRVREGYMEASIVNCWGAIGNLSGALLIFFGVRYQPSISFLLLAIWTPNILARVISTLLLWKKRPWLIRGGARPDFPTMRSLIRDGLSFSATSVIVYLVEFVACALLVGRLRGPADVAIFQVLMSVTAAFQGLLSMVGTPLWAAMVDAGTKQDHAWIGKAVRRFYRYLGLLVLGAGGGLVILGPWLLPFWYGEEFSADRGLFVCHALFLAAAGWRRVNRYLAIGLGLIDRTVLPILAGLAGGVILGGLGLENYGIWALFAGMAAGAFLVPGWYLPRLVREARNRTGRMVGGNETPREPHGV